MRASQSRGFFLFPRGLGSREEFCEAVTGLQLGIHQKRMSYLQSSICNPGTRANSLVLLVTKVAPKASDWAAMKVSKEPIAVPAFSRTVPTLTYISATVWSIGKTSKGARMAESKCCSCARRCGCLTARRSRTYSHP